jgi:hypothetical protein
VTVTTVDAGQYRALALQYRVDAPEPGVAAAFAQAYAPCSAADTSALLTIRLEAGDENAALCRAMTVIDQATVQASQDAYLVFHASAAMRPDGGTVLLLGPSGAGKTTLAAALTQQGWIYVGDEALGLNENASALVANPKPFKLDAGSCQALQVDASPADIETVFAPGVFGAHAAAGLLTQPVAVIAVEYRAGARATIEPQSRPATAELLAGQCFNFTAWGSRALDTVVQLARNVPGYRLQFGELAGAIDAIAGVTA